MSESTITRRGFMMGCSGAVAAMAGVRFNSMVYASDQSQSSDHILVTVFLRGGMDVLNFMPPLDTEDRRYYEEARGSLAVAADPALQLGSTPFMLHPNASSLRELYDEGDLAIVPATGMFVGTRSHFDAMNFMETGMPGQRVGGSGWLTRHLATTEGVSRGLAMPALAAGRFNPASFKSSQEVVSFEQTSHFHVDHGPYHWREQQREALRDLYSLDASPINEAGTRALNAIGVVDQYRGESYTPTVGTNYPTHEFGDHLKLVAQAIKSDLGLRVATVDLDGWDTHENQGNDVNGGYFDNLVRVLSDGLHAFYRDLSGSQTNLNKRVTVVVMSEFGRRLEANSNNGTDHGHGSMMMVLGSNVYGGMYGTWPSLRPDALYEGIDLNVTTDYRRVLAEIVKESLGNPNWEQVFPTMGKYEPLGIVSNQPLTAVTLSKTDTHVPSSRKATTAASLGLVATAGLVALRQRGVMI